MAVLISIILVIGCSSKPEFEIETYGVITELNKNEVVLIDLDKFNAFNNLVERIEQIVCNDSKPTIRMKDKYSEKWLGLANPCWEGVGCILIKRRNVLKIRDEKIVMNETVELDSLEGYIAKHYTNNDVSNRFSEHPGKAKISIIYDDLPITGLKKLIFQIVEHYDKLALGHPIQLTLDREIPPPPPPPPPFRNEPYE